MFLTFYHAFQTFSGSGKLLDISQDLFKNSRLRMNPDSRKSWREQAHEDVH